MRMRSLLRAKPFFYSLTKRTPVITTMRSQFFSTVKPLQEINSDKIPSRFPYGDTELHYLIRNGNVSQVETYLDEIGKKESSELAREINKKGKLPVHLLGHVEWTGTEKNKLSDRLYDLMGHQDIKKQNESLNIDEILSRYQFPTDSVTFKNLQVACTALNETRAVVKESPAHPDMNSESIEKQNEVQQKLNAMRSASYKWRELLLQNTLTEENGFLLKNMVHFIIRFQVGNCEEMAFFAGYKLMSANYQRSIEIFHFTNGDHVFVVLDRDPNSDANSPEKWGENAVVCDPMVGDVYPASETPKRLKDFTTVTFFKTKNYFTSYHPDFHHLEVMKKLQ